jgi:hypothetical protein
MAGYLLPVVPTMLNFPTFPLLLKSNIVSPTTPTFLSEPEPPPPTHPVVYSPVPTWNLSVTAIGSQKHKHTMRTFKGGMMKDQCTELTMIEDSSFGGCSGSYRV